MARCGFVKDDGSPCERIVKASQRYCYSHDPERSEERKRNAARGGRIKGSGEITDLKEQLRTLVADVLDGKVATGVGAVVNQILNTRLRAIEQERKLRELEELAGRLEALEEVLRARKAG